MPGGSGTAYGGAVTSRPAPDERHPDRLTWWGTTWRLGLALLIGLTLWILTFAITYPDPDADLPEGLRTFWLVLVDPALGLVAAALLLLRRRLPVTTAAVTTLLSGVSVVAAGAQAVAMVSLATRQLWRELVPVTLLAVVTGTFASRIVYPDPDPLPLWAETLFSLLVLAVLVAVGVSIGSRRALVRSWVDRARTAERLQGGDHGDGDHGDADDLALGVHRLEHHRSTQ